MGQNGVTVFSAPKRECDAEFTEKRSRFIGSVRMAFTAEEATEIIKSFPLQFSKANHHCWAYRIGSGTPLEHFSDAGEPSGTAGRPILGAIKHCELTNTLVVVTRYFGGIKLGVRGLIDAYKHAAELALTDAGTVEMEYHVSLVICCGYDYLKTLASTLRKWGFAEDRVNVEYGEQVTTHIEVPLSMKENIEHQLRELSARSFVSYIEWGKTFARERWA